MLFAEDARADIITVATYAQCIFQNQNYTKILSIPCLDNQRMIAGFLRQLQWLKNNEIALYEIG